MIKRTAKEIEDDYKKIKKLVDTSFITSIREIVEATGLTTQIVKTSLSKHPRVEKKIMAKLEENRQKKASLKEEAKKNLSTIEEDTKTKEEAKKGQFLGYVIDNSIIEVKDVLNIINKICESDAQIIITSITINELEDSREYNNFGGRNAKRILAMAAEDPKHFYSVIIDDSLATKDDCIVKYCADNNDKVILLTADNTMALKARAYGVETQYFKLEKVNEKESSKNKDTFDTLAFTKKVNGELTLYAMDGNIRSTLVKSNGIEYSQGECKLKKGDDVLIAVKKSTYFTFVHYKITSLYERKNCKLIFHGSFYNLQDVEKLQNEEYKTFLRKFAKKALNEEVSYINSIPQEECKNKNSLNTLYSTKLVNERLYISIINNDYKSTLVKSNGIEYSQGECKLNIGDDVYIATKKSNYLTFVHYKIISLEKEDNCKSIFYGRFYNLQDVEKLQNEEYKTFLREFAKKALSLVEEQEECEVRKSLNTLYSTKIVNERLYISIINNDYKSTLVRSNGIVYTIGEYELKIGDDVYIATKKFDYLTFAHYKITSLTKENNCNVVFYKRFTDLTDNFKYTLPKSEYKTFMRDFKKRIGLKEIRKTFI